MAKRSEGFPEKETECLLSVHALNICMCRARRAEVYTENMFRFVDGKRLLSLNICFDPREKSDF